MPQSRGEIAETQRTTHRAPPHDERMTRRSHGAGMRINEISGQIVDAAIKVHSVLGPGLLEAAYQMCLAHELQKRGLAVRREVRMPVRYDGIVLDLSLIH